MPAPQSVRSAQTSPPLHLRLDGECNWQPVDSLPLDDRGFRYGMHIFETILVRSGRAIFAARHVDKLVAGCAAAGIKVTLYAINCIAEKLASPSIDSGILRLHVTAGGGALKEPASAPTILCTAESRPPLTLPIPPASVQVSGIPAAPYPPATKSGNYWKNAAAQSDAAAKHFTDTLLFDSDGCLVSAATANVVAEIHGRWLTPHAKTGCRHGVVLDWLTPRLNIRPAVITRRDLAEATCLFLTNSWWGPRPAETLEGRKLACTGMMNVVIRDYWSAVDSFSV